jgi:sulfur-oxidizing protein SoxY
MMRSVSQSKRVGFPDGSRAKRDPHPGSLPVESPHPTEAGQDPGCVSPAFGHDPSGKLSRGFGEVQGLTRRAVIAGASAVSAAALLPRPAAASPDAMAAALKGIVGTAQPKAGRVKIEIPELAENGNSVPVTITVDSPMTAADHVKTIYILSPENPSPDVVRFHLGPRSGRAKVSTSIRLATTQSVTALAVMADGSAWTASADVIVTMSACIDPG